MKIDSPAFRTAVTIEDLVLGNDEAIDEGMA